MQQEDTGAAGPASVPYLAKLYRLGESETEWVDCGVVRVRCGFAEAFNETALILTSEDDPKRIVLETPISRSEYRRDVSTIISWADTLENLNPVAGSNGEVGTIPPSDGALYELALSFETPEGCSSIYEEICKVLGKVSSDFRIDGHPHDEDGVHLHLDGSHSLDDSSAGHHPISPALPPLSRNTLVPIVNKLKTTVSALFRSKLAAELVANEASREQNSDALSISAVLNLYDEVEKCTEDAEKRKKDLQLLFELVRSLALLDDDKIFDILLTDAYFERVAGCLENDPSVRVPPEHRRFLRQEARFNQVVPITSERVQSMIMKRFRLGFLRDVLLPRVLDESSFKRLSTMDISLSSEIARNLHEDRAFMASLFGVLNQPAGEHRVKAVAFLSELCTLSQKMILTERNSFYRTLNDDDRLLRVCERVLRDSNSATRERLDIGEILLLLLKHDVSVVRSRVLATERSEGKQHFDRGDTEEKSQDNNGDKGHHPALPRGSNGLNTSNSELNIPAGKSTSRGDGRRLSLLALLTQRLIKDEDAGVQAQARQILEILLDPETFLSQQQKEEDPLIAIFYSSYFLELVDSLESLKPERRRQFSDPDVPLNAAHLISELLCFCVRMHGYVVRELIVKRNVMEKVLGLLECREKHMVLDAIRFVRTCLGMKEQFYNDYLIKHDLFAPIMRAFNRNGPKNNLINSTVIDLLEFVKTENVAPVIEYLVTKFADDLRPIGAYVNTFKDLEELHQKNISGASIIKSPSTQSIHSNSSISDPFSATRSGRVLASTLLGGVRQHRVSAARSNIFVESRPMRDDDDEALFDDDLAASNENSPSKRPRLEPIGADLSGDFDAAA